MGKKNNQEEVRAGWVLLSLIQGRDVVPLNNRMDPFLQPLVGDREKANGCRFSPPESQGKGESRYFDVMSHGEGGGGAGWGTGWLEKLADNQMVALGGPSCWSHSSMVVGSPLLMGAEGSRAVGCLGPGGCCRRRWK